MVSDFAFLDLQELSFGNDFSVDPLRNAVGDSASARHAKQLRVLHVINGEHYAGAERVQDWLALRLPEFGINVTFACVKPDRFPKARHCQFTPLVSLPMKSRFDLRAVRQLARLIRSERFDLIHTHTPRTALVGHIAGRLAHVPHVHHVHGHTASEVGRGWLNRFSAKIECMSLSRAAAIIAVSPTASKYIHDWGVAQERIHLVPNGVPCRKGLARRGMPPNIWNLGMIALLRPRKGLDVLLQTVAILCQQKVPVKLRVIGRFESPQYEEQMVRMTDELDIGNFVQWRGFRQDVEAELDELDLAILPSILSEGMPMAVLEAMAAGVPTIGSRVEGIVDVVRDGVDGLLVNPSDPQELARAVSDVIAGKYNWQSMRHSAIANHAQHYSDAAMAAGVAQVYREVLKQ
jgi:glycosyltransferase involved in cell wall biosynthesis